MTTTVRVKPVDDGIEHGCDDCLCGPTTLPLKLEDGSVGWVVVHHSVDGREAAEA